MIIKKTATQKKCESLYSKGGAGAVRDYCEKIKHTEYAFCEECDSEVPITKDWMKSCLVCGGNTKVKPSIDDYLPLFREDNSMVFETYGEDLEFVRIQKDNHVWTLVDGDDGESIIVAGYHFVNRVHYIITLKPWKDSTLAFPYID